MWYIYSKKMFNRRAKQIRIIGFPNKWSSTVPIFQTTQQHTTVDSNSFQWSPQIPHISQQRRERTLFEQA